MTFALIKLSYNNIGEKNVKGGICGAGFFIDNETFVTAYHIFNSTNNFPNVGFRNCQYWLASRSGQIIEIKNVTIQNYPEIDTTVIRFNNRVTDNIVNIDRNTPIVGDDIYNQGYIPNMPQIDAGWRQNGLILRSINLNVSLSDANGSIREINNTTITAKDVNITNRTLITTSYPGRVGMSGGPMFNENDDVIGLMSIGLPADVLQKDFLGAIWINEILNTI
jgi:V8-like Glu-specific endopeptidase